MKDKLSKIVHRTEKGGANTGGEGSYRSALSVQSEPGIVVEGELGGGEIKVGVGKDDPQPDDVQSVSPSAEGISHDQGESDDKASGGETSKKHLHPHPHMQAESGSSQGRRSVDGQQADRADPPPQSDIEKSTPIPSILRGGVSEGT